MMKLTIKYSMTHKKVFFRVYSPCFLMFLNVSSKVAFVLVLYTILHQKKKKNRTRTYVTFDDTFRNESSRDPKNTFLLVMLYVYRKTILVLLYCFF